MPIEALLSAHRAQHKAAPQILAITDFGVGDNATARMHQMAHQIGIPSSFRWVEVADVRPYSLLNGMARMASMALPERLAPRSVVIGVVDPHVGEETAHPRLMFQLSSGVTYIGPDNGLFTPILKKYEEQITLAIHIDIHPIAKIVQEELKMRKTRTFHGETIFTSVAVLIAGGADPRMFGKEVSPEQLNRIEMEENTIIDIDAYGNLKFARSALLEGAAGDEMKLTFTRGEEKKVVKQVLATIQEQIENGEGRRGTYQLVRSGSQPSPLNVSVQCSELFLIEKNAAKDLGVRIGDVLEIEMLG